MDVIAPEPKRAKMSDNSQGKAEGDLFDWGSEDFEDDGAAAPCETDPRSNEVLEIDDAFYNRQRYVLGDEAMKSLAKGSVFLSGLDVLGVEIAKNLVLAGVGSLTLHDTRLFGEEDRVINFVANPSNIGQKRADAVAKHMSEINSTVKIVSSSDDIFDLERNQLSFLNQYKCVVLADHPLKTQVRVNQYCRKRGIHFVGTNIYGVLGSVFVDFGDNFETRDKDGVAPIKFLVGNVSRSNPGIVRSLQSQTHGLEDGCYVTFKEVGGMSELNGSVHEVKVINRFEFQIGDTTSFSPFSMGGVCTEIKRPQLISFKSLAQCLMEPKLVDYISSKFGRPLELCVLHQAVDKFLNGRKLSSRFLSTDEVHQVMGYVDKISTHFKITPDVPAFSRIARSILGCHPSIGAYLGGVVAQEVMKSVVGKFTPINQQFYVDFEELLPQSTEELRLEAPKDTVPLLVCLGEEVVQSLKNASVFMVGSGAIGCELLKNLSALNVSSGHNSTITVTDGDFIEKSNLSRQFLFRHSDIKKPKSTTAAERALSMNPDVKIHAMTSRVGKETESIFTDSFFKKQNAVLNALDNIPARRYVDDRCVNNHCPLIDSGTLGLLGHVQVHIPDLTDSYNSNSSDPDEVEYPMCTLKFFPSSVEHTIQYARDKFEAEFCIKPTEASRCLHDAGFAEELMTVKDDLTTKRLLLLTKFFDRAPASFQDCIKYARIKFEKYFKVNIQKLLELHPEGSVTEGGVPFWAPPKRVPKVIEFSLDCPSHLDFVYCLAFIRALNFGIEPHARQVTAEVLSNYDVASEIRNMQKIKNSQKELSCEELRPFFQESFLRAKSVLRDIIPVAFEKDDDGNNHVRFVAAFANIRADCYSIDNADYFQVKKISGGIIPAISTTTSAVSGLVTIEFTKLLKKCKKEEHFNANLNLGIGNFSFFEPNNPPLISVIGEEKITMWTKWEFQIGVDQTLADFLSLLKEKCKLEPDSVLEGSRLVYMKDLPGQRKKLPEKLTKLIPRGHPGQEFAVVNISFTDGSQEYSSPPTKLFFPKDI